MHFILPIPNQTHNIAVEKIKGNMKHSENWKLGMVFRGEVKPENDEQYGTGWQHISAHIESNDGIIGEVKAFSAPNFAPLSTFEPNAALILAAPDLFDACNQLMDCYRQHGKLLAFNVDIVRQALAKVSEFSIDPKTILT